MTAVNDFDSYLPALDSPPANAVAVSPDDNTDLAHVARALWIGTTGDVCVNLAGSGTAIVFKSVPVGYLIGMFQRVRSTNTTATNIVAVW